MAFTRALFYPTIDIHNEDWLKTAVLFWDKISTIVPDSISNPYQEHSTQYLHDIGILTPIKVDSNQKFIEELTQETIKYLDTKEGIKLLTQGKNGNNNNRGDQIRDINSMFEIHPQKLPYEIQKRLSHGMTTEGWISTDSNFANFYMTLLANKICERNAIAPLTDNSLTFNLFDTVKLDNTVVGDKQEIDHNYLLHHRGPDINLSQGLLMNIIIEGISISDQTSLGDVIKFKTKHKDELGLFRKNVANLTKDIPADASLKQISQMVRDVYTNEFLPGYNGLKAALSSSRIKWFSEKFMTISLISTGATTLPSSLLGLSVPNALFSGVGLSVLSSLISYNSDKRTVLRNNPYSYLLAANKGI